MPYTPPRSACFRPEAYDSLELYADREADLHDLTETIDGFVQGPGAEGRILIRGARGVGKSTLTRRALRMTPAFCIDAPDGSGRRPASTSPGTGARC